MSTKSADTADGSDSMASYLAEHPRMAGVLFALLVLLSQAGNAAATALQANAGP